MRRFTPAEGAVSAALRGTRSLAGRDIEGIATLLIDAEMAMFRGLPTPVIWMQNVVVDLLVGLGMDDALAIFARHVESRYGAQPGVHHHEPDRDARRTPARGDRQPVDLREHQQARVQDVRRYGGVPPGAREPSVPGGRHVGVFASGAIPPREAIEWVCEQPNIESIVFGASRRANLLSTKALVDKFWGASQVRGELTGQGVVA